MARKNLKQLVEDGKRTQWKKGQPPANPAGRPRVLPSLNAALTRVFGVTSDTDISKVDEILEAMRDQAIRKGNVQAANLILDRMHGKVKQTNVIINGGMSKEDVSGLFPFAPPDEK